MIGTSATLGVAHQQGWGAFGEFEQTIMQADTCKARILQVGWSTGAGSRSLAKTNALIGWSKKAARHGHHYASWHNAQNRNVLCKVSFGNVAKCTAKGRPCPQQPQLKLDILF